MLGVRTQTSALLDEKGRLSLPAPLKTRLLADRVHSLVLHCYRGAVWGWTPADFAAKVEARFTDADPFAVPNLDFVHAVLSYNDEVEIDRAGRVRIPPDLREQAGLTREVKLFSVMDRLEIWDHDRWSSRFREAQQAANRPPTPDAA